MILAPPQGAMLALRGVTLLTLAAMAPAQKASPAPAPGPASYLCYQARGVRAGNAAAGFDGPAGLAVTDRFATRQLDVRRPVALCRPTQPLASAPMLAGFAAGTSHDGARGSRRVGIAVDLVNRFGREAVVLKTLGRLLVPSAATGAAPAGRAEFACYEVKTARRRRQIRATVADALGERLLDVRQPTRLCVAAGPADDGEVLCYATRVARPRPLAQPKATPRATTLATVFGTGTLRVGHETELCVPSIRPFSPPPAPSLTLQVTPSALTVQVGEHPAFVATAHFEDGTDADYTNQVLWHSSDESVAVTRGSVGGAFVNPVGPGTTTISVVDPASGASSSEAGGDATLTVTWPLEKLTISPHAVVKRPGDHEGYTVTGYFTGGVTKNLTQRVVYASSDPAVAVATNTPGNRSRVEALAAGTTTISATDPISGISTTDSGNDATLRVTPALSYIWLSGGGRFVSRFPGESLRLTAHGVFVDGSSLNLTQRCTWTSSDPAVAVATNPDGDRSRVDAVAPGLTYVTCTDPQSGLSSYGAQFWVLGALTAIEVYGSSSPVDWLRNGEALRLTAIGQYQGGGQRNLTQQVMWMSRDPDIAIAPNAAGDRSRIVAVDGGDARVFATDPTTGIESNDTLVHALGDLVGLEILQTYRPNVIPLGGTGWFAVRGIFENAALNLSQTRGGYEFQSSDPTVAEIVGDGLFIHALAAGTTDITARDVTTGVTSAAVSVTVKGDLASIALDPPAATRGIGEWESFTAIGHYPPDFTELLTQVCVYASSDPSVAVADNLPPNRSRVRTVGAGTVTITATHPPTGISASAVLTVLPGTIERITIQPDTIVRNSGNDFSFTAIGHYPDGRTLNVTQVVTWTSLAPDVAEATNQAGNRSRVVGRSPGTAVITARHPSSVGSHDTGDDATFIVKPLVATTLTPSLHTGQVGDVVSYTLVGTFDDATTINLTQDAYYWTEEGDIALFDNVAGNRSAGRLFAPGTTTVHAVPVEWGEWWYHVPYPPVGGSVAGAVLTVEP
ncbi:MAG: Ig-like domain-containing protein [Candidatus Binatia bacterium]